MGTNRTGDGGSGKGGEPGLQHLGKDDKGFLITKIDLTVKATVPGLDDKTFQEHAEKTKTGCIISRSLAATPMTLKATLAG